MIQFTPANTLKGEKFSTLNGRVTGEVESCHYCPHERTDYVVVVYTIHWAHASEQVVTGVRADEIKRIA